MSENADKNEYALPDLSDLFEGLDDELVSQRAASDSASIQPLPETDDTFDFFNDLASEGTKEKNASAILENLSPATADLNFLDDIMNFDADAIAKSANNSGSQAQTTQSSFSGDVVTETVTTTTITESTEKAQGFTQDKIVATQTAQVTGADEQTGQQTAAPHIIKEDNYSQAFAPKGAVRIGQNVDRAEVSYEQPVTFSPQARTHKFTPDLDFKFGITVTHTAAERISRQLDLKNYKILCNPIVNILSSKISGYDFALGIHDSGNRYFTKKEIENAFLDLPELEIKIDRAAIAEVFRISLSPTRRRYKILTVPISTKYLWSRSFISDISTMIDNIGQTPDDIYFEFTEDAFMQNKLLSQVRFEILRGLGINISVSNLSRRFFAQLKISDLQLDLIRINSSLTQEYLYSSRVRNVVFDTLAYANLLRVPVIAKGISDNKLLRTFYDLGIKRMTGSYLTFRAKR